MCRDTEDRRLYGVDGSYSKKELYESEVFSSDFLCTINLHLGQRHSHFRSLFRILLRRCQGNVSAYDTCFRIMDVIDDTYIFILVYIDLMEGYG